MRLNTIFTLEYFVFRKADKGWEIPTRTIDNHELVFVTKGEGEVTINGKSFPLKEQTLLYFHPNQLHSLRTDSNLCFYGMHFSFADNLEKLDLPDLSIVQDNTIMKQLFTELATVHAQKAYLHQWSENIILNQILLQVHLNLHKDNAPSNIRRVRNAIEYIHRTPYAKFTIDELCHEAGLKKSLFMEAFKEATGTSPLQYCIALKIEYAKDLLLEQQALPIQKIATICGFEDSFYFSRLFKKHVGISPQQFRAQRNS